MPLLMTWFHFVDNADTTLTTDNDVVGADFFDTRTHFHPVRNPFLLGVPCFGYLRLIKVISNGIDADCCDYTTTHCLNCYYLRYVILPFVRS